MYKKYSDSTLLSLPKKELLLHLRAAEHNRDVAEQTLEQQAKNMKDWQPVRRGRWETKETALGKKYTVCSACDTACVRRAEDGELLNLDMTGAKYCPWCGAKMKDVEV